MVYACVCVYEYNDVYFVAGMTLVVLAAAVYSYSYVHKIYKGYISDSTTYNADIKDISKRMYITGVAIVVRCYDSIYKYMHGVPLSVIWLT